MRRLMSLLIATLTVASGFGIALPYPVHAASADVTIIRNTDFAPAAVPNARISQIVRLAKSDSFLVLGRDTTVVDSNLFVWKLKGDLTIDSTFPAVDLGTNFSHPSPANSDCTATTSSYGCMSTSLYASEVADTFFVGAYRSGIRGTNQQTLSVFSMALVSLSTGAILGQIATASNPSSGAVDLSPWAQYFSRQIGRDECVEAFGSSFQSTPLEYAYAQYYSIMIRPDGSIIIPFNCEYSNDDGTTTSVAEFYNSVYVAFKPSNNSLILDTSFGVGGYLKMFDDPSKCLMGGGGGNPSYDRSITSNSSTKIFSVAKFGISSRSTTVPSYLNNGRQTQVTSYNGCNFSNASNARPSITSQFLSFTANGTIKKQTTGSTDDFFINRWVIDSNSSWTGIAESFSSNGPNSGSTFSLVRVLSDGSLDSSLGTSGMRSLSNLPSSVQIDNTTVQLYYQLYGAAITESGTLFVGFGTRGGSYQSCQENRSGTSTTSVNPYYFDDTEGLITSYGTNGIGQSFSYEEDIQSRCDYSYLGQTRFVNSAGQPALVRQTEAIGSQAAGLVLVTWNAATGVIGGGDGSGELNAGGNGRVDNKIYSRKLPRNSEINTSLKVLKRKDLKTQRLVSRTPKICTIANGTVLMLRKGTCSVGVVNKATNKFTRSLTTSVKETTTTVGSTLTRADAVYFNRATSRLTKKTRTQVKEMLETAKEAKRIYVIGHSAQLFDDSIYNYAISRNRARNVAALLRSELRKAKIRVPVVVIAEGSRALLTNKKTETAQSKNRRVEVYFG